MNGMNGGAGQDIDLYEILKIDKNASKSEIKKAYHKAALANHPDKVPEDQREEAEARFKAASQAYEILYDEQKREMYDTHGMAAFEGGGGPGGMGVNMEDILGGLFGMNMGGMGGMGRGSQRPKRSPDENQKYEVTLEDLYKGKTVRFTSTKNVICSKCTGSGAKEGVTPRECSTCKACEGSGKVVNPKDKCKKCKGKRTTEEKKQLELYIPRGAKEGDKIVLEGEADQIPGADQTGDIIFHLVEQPHDIFNRAGPDLQATLEVTLAEALTGFNRVVVTHLDGRGISLSHPQVEGEIMRPGQVIKVRGEGMPYKKSDAKGDLYLIVDIQFPEDGFFTPEAADALRKLLPPPEPPIKTEVVDDASWEDADPEEFGKGDPRGGGQWVDADEEGAEGPQCATQ
ncbi:DnaJ-like protein xdj1 [Lithohypha guttulata]|uniref:DnaJ-like protein xdj1 n=1 Tax=Lithohypha guttulata TaxID=1690604 RepID=A0AAN7T7N1_9EURO|nr:DnaJ-like protein xdj1 [Lithohypha guttulata]KAK5089981.1 DnaJ-like protein xdj1 [Lithohypha guttulata]